MHRKIQDHTQAQRCLDAARRAGMTPGEWARDHGFDGRSLNAWRINLARSKPRHRADSGRRLIELVASDLTARAPAGVPMSGWTGSLVVEGDALVGLSPLLSALGMVGVGGNTALGLGELRATPLTSR